MQIMMGLSLLLAAMTFAIVRCEWVPEMENPGLFEGDIQLDPDEREGRFKTNSYASIKGGRWPGAIIPYSISSSIGSRGQTAIKEAIDEYQRKTCIKFQRRTRESAHIEFYRGRGCSSPVGYRGGRKNTVSLAAGCWTKGIVMHEIGHSIGLYHEQSRPDRDSHVRILWNNIQSNMRFNFNKQSSGSINSLGTKYDFLSMMHYGATAFGSGRRTIETIDPNNQRLIGQRRGFSDIDIKQINLMYCGGTGTGVAPTTGTGCVNLNSRCDEWANRGECTKNPRYMLQFCKLSCKSC